MSRLSTVRKQKGIKGLELARSVGINPTGISAIENRRIVPNAKIRAKIAEVLELPEAKLFRADGLAKA